DLDDEIARFFGENGRFIVVVHFRSTQSVANPFEHALRWYMPPAGWTAVQSHAHTLPCVACDVVWTSVTCRVPVRRTAHAAGAAAYAGLEEHQPQRHALSHYELAAK